jgi:hypothetical protein
MIMPAKEIKELRQSGRTDEAYLVAKTELDAQPANIWAKRNISWVLYDYLKQNADSTHYEGFIAKLKELADLQLPVEEKMLFDQLAWQVGKMIFAIAKDEHPDSGKAVTIFDLTRHFSFTKPSEGYSFLGKALHKIFKDSDIYTSIIDWWELDNFRKEDFIKDRLPNGKEMMSFAEQVHIAYAKHLLPKVLLSGERIFDENKVKALLPVLDKVIENHPDLQYPPYYKAKLLLALGSNDNAFSALLPFAKKKRNDFWVWDVLSEAFPDNDDRRIACLCRALLCNTSEDFFINIRQKLAGWFVEKEMWDKAKTEIDLLIATRVAQEWKIPAQVQNWTAQNWYTNAQIKKSNLEFYKLKATLAEELLYSDIPEEIVLIEFINKDKKIANFIASDAKFGFFKYDRFVEKLEIGDTIKVRFQNGSNEGLYHLMTAELSDFPEMRSRYMKVVEGNIRVPSGKPFGFIEDAFVHPSIIEKYKLSDGSTIKATAIRSFNPQKNEWGWKVYSV